MGSLVAQTVQGTMSYNNNVELWYTLSFPSPVHLEPGAYWLMAVHSGSNFLLIYNDVGDDTYTSVSSVIGGVTFPASLPSPFFSPSFVYCIYAS